MNEAPGALERMQERIERLETALVKLCAKFGHSDELSSWDWCGIQSHSKADDEDEKDSRSRPPHRTRCEICGQWKCQREDV